MSKQNAKNSTTRVIASTPVIEMPVPEQHALIGAGDKSPAFGKPEMTQAESDALAINEAKARQTITDASAPSTESVYVPNETEKKFARLGFKSARTTGDQGVISVNADSMTDIMLKGLFVGLIGIDTGNKKKALVKVNLDTLDSLIAALPAHVARAKGASNVMTGQWWISKLDQSARTNKLGRAEMCDGLGDVEINGIKITLISVDQEFFGRKSASGKTRLNYMIDVKFSDSTSEVIASFWIEGLFSAINARKLAITGDHFTGKASDYDQRANASAPTASTDADAESEENDADASTES